MLAMGALAATLGAGLTAEAFVNDICLPSKLWMLSDVQNEIYVQPFLKRWRPYDDFVRFSLTPRNLPFKRQLGAVVSIDRPSDGSTLTAELVNGDEFKTIKKLEARVCVGKTGVGDRDVYVQVVGDSYTHGSFFAHALVSSGYVPKVHMVGLRRYSEAEQCHEGRGGWTLASYFKAPKGLSSYHGFMHPKDGRYWGDTTFWQMAWRCVRKTQPKGFEPLYSCEYFGDAAKRFDEGTGVLLAPKAGDYQFDGERKTFVRFDGEAWRTVAETGISWAFDYGKYLAMWNLPKPQILFEMLGVNDFSGGGLDADYTEWERRLATFKESYLKAVPGGRFVICTPCTTLGSIDNFSGLFTPKCNAAMWRFREWLIKTYDGREKDGYYLVDTALAVDSRYGYYSGRDRDKAVPFVGYPGKERIDLQYGNPHPYNSYRTMGIPLAAFVQYWRDR